ncbi:MAG: helix-turn-helix transcriptional regulator [Planctomycetaceae bacterium]|nr:helix-turn-helix transcriptional regulator [Planctomycetales bacterium]MCB9925376.1 helix-turn-helix transcriptional regulator [Planctomycetaceae bacterium]
MTISIMADSDILQRFGERVRELRKECGWSQEELALECGLDRTYMGGIERGERNVALRNIGKIAEALGLTVADLMDGV